MWIRFDVGQSEFLFSLFPNCQGFGKQSNEKKRCHLKVRNYGSLMSRPLRIRKANVNQPIGEGIWQCPSCRLMRVDFVVTGCQAIWSLYNLCKSIGTILHWAGLHHAFPLPETLFIKVKIFTSVSQKSSTEQISGSTSHPTKQPNSEFIIDVGWKKIWEDGRGIKWGPYEWHSNLSWFWVCCLLLLVVWEVWEPPQI